MFLEMKQYEEFRQAVNKLRIKHHAKSMYGGGPHCKGIPPGPIGTQSGGGNTFPNYGPEIKSKTLPPGPVTTAP